MIQPEIYLTPQEYLEIERGSATRHEYYYGKLYAMAGASFNHNRIVSNIVVGYGSKIKPGGCDIFSSDLRVHIPQTQSFVYPDIVIVCGKEEFFDREKDTLLNPLIIMEVLSESTAEYDRTTKFRGYRRIESLKEYLLVAQDTMRVEQYVRQTEELWTYRVYETPDALVRLESAGVELAVAEIYAKVNFEEEERKEE